MPSACSSESHRPRPTGALRHNACLTVEAASHGASTSPRPRRHDADPIAFIDKVKNEVKRKDSHELVAMMQDITGAPPKMWGPSIVGFGSYRYTYASGH